jgi:hypothetical protein
VGEFVALADVLRPPVSAVAAADESPPALESARVLEPVSATAVAEPEPRSDEPVSTALADALRDARLFRARLADAFDDARTRLVRELAASVLARELRLAPCDLDALVARVAADAPVVRVRVAPSDVAAVRGVAVVADPELTDGDAVVELAGGALDARLGVRLALVLETLA